MKQEDIDKKIGMPDVEAEWAKFEREVINQKTASRKPLYWGIGIAASIALVAGILFFGYETERETDFTQPDYELQGRIAGLTIVPTSEDLGAGSIMRLRGSRVAEGDSVRIERKPNYACLVVVNGQPMSLSEAEEKQILFSNYHVYFYHRQQIVDSCYIYKDEEAKRPYIEKYGERAKNGVLVFTTVLDTLCDAYVQQHPELMQTCHRVEGYIIDEDTQKPLPDTWISYRVVADTWTVNYKNVANNRIKYTDGAGAATDSTGHFILWLPRKDVKLQALRSGYKTVRINQPADTTLTIRMKSAIIIKDVEVKGIDGIKN